MTCLAATRAAAACSFHAARAAARAAAPAALLLGLALLAAPAGQAQTKPAAKPPAKAVKAPAKAPAKAPGKTPAKASAKAPAAPRLPEAPGEQMAAASMTHFGTYQCEFGESITVDMNREFDGYIDVHHRKTVWTMKPVLSSTGAIRLEDVKGRILVLQIAHKSMVMDTAAGRRLFDDCVHQKQREALAAYMAASAAAATASQAAAVAADAAADAASAAQAAAAAAARAASAASAAAR